MKVLLAASEVTPIIKTGGLADVVGALPIELVKQDIDARIIIPAYAGVDVSEYGSVRVAAHDFMAGQVAVSSVIYEGRLPESQVPIYFVAFEPGLKSKDIYPLDPKVDQDRFSLFSLAIVEWLKGSQWQPDIIHGQDWMTGTLLSVIRDGQLPYRTLLTIHNSHYQGPIDAELLERLDVSYEVNPDSTRDGLIRANQLKMGLLKADKVNTVSRTYAKELMEDGLGFGLESAYRLRHKDFSGIVNGLDVKRFGPSHNPHLKPGYSPRTAIRTKQQHKHMLQVQLGLPLYDDVPLYGMVSRASGQKGFYVLAEVLESSPFLETAQMVILAGRGTVAVEKELERLAKKYKKSLRVILGFDDDLSHKIYAASDFFVMPSKREPCGLTQMIAMRYGAVPIVHKTGGLADTVVDIRNLEKGQGIVFSDYAAQGLGNALGRSMGLYNDKHRLHQVIKVGMAEDWSWSRPAQAYIELYQELVSKTRI